MEVSVAAYGELPQIKAVILVNAEGDNKKFFRGEIMTVLRLIIYQMGQRRLIKHMKLPAMVLSIMANRARLIEAFWENAELVFRVTPLYDFPEGIPHAFLTLAEWFHPWSPYGLSQYPRQIMCMRTGYAGVPALSF